VRARACSYGRSDGDFASILAGILAITFTITTDSRLQ
jgi:hypothetical protein